MHKGPIWPKSVPDLQASSATSWATFTFVTVLAVKMPEEHNSYLPVHNGMPTSLPCSQPVDLISISAVEAFLAGTPFASRSITALPGGNINYLYRIQLVAPFEGSETVVLKHAQAFWKTSLSTAWGVERLVRAREP